MRRQNTDQNAHLQVVITKSFLHGYVIHLSQEGEHKNNATRKAQNGHDQPALNSSHDIPGTLLSGECALNY